MRVLHVISWLSPHEGGPSAALVGLAAHQRRAGLDVTACAGWREGEETSMVEALRAKGVDVVTVGPCHGPLGRHPEMRGEVTRLVREADVCHVHEVWEQIQHEASRACRAASVPFVFRPCGMLDPWCLAQSRWKKRIYAAVRARRDWQQAAAIHYTTETECRLVTPLRLRPPSLVEPNGVDFAEFDALPARGVFRGRYPDVGDRPMVLFLGRVHQKKGLDLLIPAFARADTSKAILVIAGPDDRGYLATARQMAIDHGLEGDVLFTGILRGPDRIAAYVDADFFVLPSYQENFGVVVVEALAAGCPVIISDQVNIHDDVSAAGAGVVVPAEIEPLAVAIEHWLADADAAQACARNASAFVRERYDWAEIARRWAAHYQRIIDGGLGGPWPGEPAGGG